MRTEWQRGDEVLTAGDGGLRCTHIDNLHPYSRASHFNSLVFTDIYYSIIVEV